MAIIAAASHVGAPDERIWTAFYCLNAPAPLITTWLIVSGLSAFKLPVNLRHPYPNTDCLKCHAESVKWLAVHDEFKASLFSGETSCMQCHGEANPAHNVRGEVGHE